MKMNNQPLCEQTPEESEEQALERNRELDRDERDALVDRMMEKDKSKTKKAELGGLTPAQVRSGAAERGGEVYSCHGMAVVV